MIRIDINRIQSFETEYFDLVKIFFKYNHIKQGKKGNIDCDKLRKRFKNKKDLTSKMFRFLHNNFSEIILLHPSKFEEKFGEFLTFVGKSPNDKQYISAFENFKKSMINYYSTFFQEKLIIKDEEINYGRWLTKKLNINVCPYCNHSYIFTLNDAENEIYSKPEFDHFFNKSQYPLFALSLYNLIPSCSVCNRIKGEKGISFHPYDNTEEDIIFRLKNKEEGKTLNWITGEKPKIEVVHRIDGKNESLPTNMDTSVKKLGIDKVYDEHGSFAEELVDKIFAYHNDYYESLAKSFRGLGKTPEQIDSIIWSAYLNNEGEKPMSKLTHDILKQTGIKNY